MTQVYSNPSRASDQHSLPDVETFHHNPSFAFSGDFSDLEPGWYYWPCFPGCLPDGEPIGPFASEAEAIKDAQEGGND